ncbi:oxygen-independent coproporphyrinogen III oxidase [Halotalea alkalilenta]|uniref:oxygen-independent coproporphyrinogen III oxidase n=1 Tax=Halotalea alkalilenta TaxID=376489 RepID=UPI00047FD396|nr:oxygen-independent coproporphyrinogen III oxidase [Halotalea alkalilenta]
MQSSNAPSEAALIAKYDSPGPRYTSYPTALNFTAEHGEPLLASEARRHPSRPLSLYVHLPFCRKLCYYCGCNKLISHDPTRADRYLDLIEREVTTRALQFAGRQVVQLHWGGGTPTYLDDRQVARLMALLRERFDFAAGAERSIEIDPRGFAVERLEALRAQGFNRISIGVQDFDPLVQRTINRVQDEALIEALIDRARALAFDSINLDLIYGLPMQRREGFANTVARVIALAPDRLSVFGYAHLPSRFPAQRLFSAESLPDAAARLEMLTDTGAALERAGYRHIGMDHFARPSDELAIAQREGRLHRNFQGYTTFGDCDLLGLGSSSISTVGHAIVQNHKSLKAYRTMIERDGHALWGGIALDRDDLLRGAAIRALICNLGVNVGEFETSQRALLQGAGFVDYFAEALDQLSPLIEDGLVSWDGTRLAVEERGRRLVRRVCMAFDRYLSPERNLRYSKVI